MAITPSVNLTQAEAKLETITDSLRVAVLALEVERGAICNMGQTYEDDLQAILGLGVLLNDLQVRRNEALVLSRSLPSPNRLRGTAAERVARLSTGLFDAMAHIRNIQSEIYRLARLNLRAASHKVSFVSKVQASAAQGSSPAAV
jgi:hypothetical protein